MKKLFSLVAVMIIAATAFSQEVTEATITTIGTGVDEEKATLQALRSAIEQTFGTFVSANTTILNDKMVQDEIVSVSNGNVKQYKKIAVATLPNKQVSVTVTATISINKLITYAQSKGSRAEFAGQTFATNLRLMQLRAKSAEKLLDLMTQQLDRIAKDMFDYKLTLTSSPYFYNSKELGPVYFVGTWVDVYSNAASTQFYTILTSTLEALKLSTADVAFCKKSGIENSLLLNYALPISSKKSDNIIKKINAAITNALVQRYSIREINNPQSSFYLASKYNEDGTDEGIYRPCSSQRKSSSGPFIDEKNDLVWYFYSSQWKQYIGAERDWENGHSQCSLSTDYLTPAFCLDEIRTPIELTKQQKKELKKGLYAGPTYIVSYKNPKFIAAFGAVLPVKKALVDQGRFQGFEIVTK